MESSGEIAGFGSSNKKMASLSLSLFIYFSHFLSFFPDVGWHEKDVVVRATQPGQSADNGALKLLTAREEHYDRS